jgi:hypothetical protein
MKPDGIFWQGGQSQHRLLSNNFQTNMPAINATNPPVVKLIWPLDEMVVSGTNITLRGTMSDETGGIVATIVNGDGTTNTLTGLVERNGDFWVENVPLNGVNQISLQATDAAGNVTTTNFSVNASSLTVTIDTVPTGDDLWQPTGNVSGQISDPTASVVVNGVQGTNYGNGTWSAAKVPIYGTGTATFNVSATPANPPSGAAAPRPAPAAHAAYSSERQPMVIVSQHAASQEIFQAPFTQTGLAYPIQFNTDQINYGATLSPDTNDHWHLNYFGRDDFHKTFIVIHFKTWFTWNPLGQSRYAFNGGVPIPHIPFDDYVAPNVRAVHYYASGFRFWQDSPRTSDGSFNRLMVNLAAQTQLRLYTGGKAQVGTPNLISLRASASQIEAAPIAATLTQPWRNAKITPIKSKYLQVGNFGKPNASGIVLKTDLPDNATADVTVVAQGYGHYSATVIAKKYKVEIKANTEPLDLYDSNLTTCVGQRMTFSLGWSPANPSSAEQADFLNISVHWSLPGTFVNTNADHNCPAYYTKDPAQLIHSTVPYTSIDKLTSTSGWYVEALKGGTAKMIMNLTFKDGSQWVKKAAGKFRVVRPKVLNINKYPDGTPTVMVVGQVLTLGNGRTNDMSFGHQINPGNFSGVAGYTQLVSGDYTEPLNTTCVPIPIGGAVAHDIELDKQEFPRGRSNAVPANTFSPVSFWDQPYAVMWNGCAEENLDFFTYLLFKPDAGPEPNIFVPLRLITWELKDAAMNGAVQAGSRAAIIKDEQTSDFPKWTKTFSRY